MEDIQSWWELPSIAHFCSLFRAAFDLLDFDIEELEEAILTDGLERSGSPLLVELLVRLIQGCLPNKNVSSANFETFLKKLFKQKCQSNPSHENLFLEGSFRTLSLRRKVEILHALCDFRLEADDVLDVLKNLETESLRVEPLGFDDHGATYWYFYGTRLYREDHSRAHPYRKRQRERDKPRDAKHKKKKKKPGSRPGPDSDSEDSVDENYPPAQWQVQCYSEEDWRSLSSKFEGRESRLEKSLSQTLVDDFLPEIPRLFKEKEKLQQKRMLEFAPRRSSGRVQKLREKKEEQEKKEEEEGKRSAKANADTELGSNGLDDSTAEEWRNQRDDRRSSSPSSQRLAGADQDYAILRSLRLNPTSKPIAVESEEAKKPGHRRRGSSVESTAIAVTPSVNKQIYDYTAAPLPSPPTNGEDRLSETDDGNSPSLRYCDVADPRDLPPKSPDARNKSKVPAASRKKKKEAVIFDKIKDRWQSDVEDNLDKESSGERFGAAVGSGRGDCSPTGDSTTSRPPKVKKRHHRKHHKRHPDCKRDHQPTHQEKPLIYSEDDLDDAPPPQLYKGRKTNNSLSSLAFSLTPSTVVPEPSAQMVGSPPNMKKVKSAHMLLQTEDDLRTGMYKVLENLRGHEDAWPFLDPVDDSFAPNYYAVIRRPMYIARMESRLDSGFYATLSMFEADFKLMMDNCKLYNGPDSEYTHMAYTLEKVFRKLKCKYLESEFSSDEEIYIDMSFQNSSKKKKRRSTNEEKESDDTDTAPKPREKHKKKSGRPKAKADDSASSASPLGEPEPCREPADPVLDEVKREELPAKRPRGRPKSSSKKDPKIDRRRKSKEEHVEKRTNEFVDRHLLDPQADSDDDYSEPLLLVREDPDTELDYEEPFINSKSSVMSPQENTSVKSRKPKPTSHQKEKPNELEPERGDLSQLPASELVPNGDEVESLAETFPKRAKRGRPKKSKVEERITLREPSFKSKKPISSPADEFAPVVSDSDSDAEGGFLLYYNHDDNSDGASDQEKEKKAATNDAHNDLFGEIDDLEDDDEDDEKENLPKREHTTEEKEKKLRKSESKQKRRHHKSDKRHHHHHRHRSKLKEDHGVGQKHRRGHRKKSAKHSGGEQLSPGDSPSKKVLKVEEVFDLSDDHFSRGGDRSPLTPLSPRVRQPEPDSNHEDGYIFEKDAVRLSHKKRKNRRKDKHEHSKKSRRKGGKVKNRDKRDKRKRKSIKRIIKKKRKEIPIKKMAAIDALSAATEQTLKDITCLLDDPHVPKFSGDSPLNSIPSPSRCVSSQEFEPVAFKIEAEYRRKLKMEPSADKKHHKKKRKSEEHPEAGSNKKLKKEPVDAKENFPCKVEKEWDAELNDDGVLDNSRDLFKDIKDGRIKPGAIIKSKDIAKKEGVVKKETKTSTESKPKAKQNPFGKINKQENSKLTTLIAKAKESRIGLVPNSEVGDSPKLSLGSIIMFGDIGSSKRSSREPNSADEDDASSEKFSEREKWDSPWDSCWDKVDVKDELSDPPSQSLPEDEEKDDLEEEVNIPPSPENGGAEELAPPPTPTSGTLALSRGGPDLRQERATPNLSAWFKAFGGPKSNATPNRKPDGESDDDDNENDPVEAPADELFPHQEAMDGDEEPERDEIGVCSPVRSPLEHPLPSPRPLNDRSPEPPISPSPPPEPTIPDKPPETPWFDKIDEKEDEPIWKKNKTEDDDEDPYKFEEEELDRAREEAKKLEVERQRKASVSSSGISDPSPLNIDTDRSPAAFSSEGERSPLTRSPSTRSPLTPGFGNPQSFSPATEKSPGMTAYSPRFDSSMGKSFSAYDDKTKYQGNGPIKVGFYQDMTDKSQDKTENPKSIDQKLKESPIYSPTVPYVSPLYSNKDQIISKQKSPMRYSNYYTSIDSSTLDKPPKTPGYYPTSGPSTPSDKPSPSAGLVTEEKSKTPTYNYYTYDPTKSLTDQYKNSNLNASAKQYLPNNSEPLSGSRPQKSPLGSSNVTEAPRSNMQMMSKLEEKIEPAPRKKRQTADKKQKTVDSYLSSWEDKREEIEKTLNSAPFRNPFSPHSLPANLANLSHIVSRIPDPETDSMIPNLKDSLRMGAEQSRSQSILGKAVQSPNVYDHPPQTPSVVPVPDHSSPLADLAFSSPHLISKTNNLNPPPAAHQKSAHDVERPGSRAMPPPPSEEKARSYLHQKTMWSSSLPCSIPSSLSSLVSSIALSQKGLGSFSSDPLAQFGMDRATLASLAGRSSQAGSQLFHPDLLQRNSSQNQMNASAVSSSAASLSLQSHFESNSTSSSGSQHHHPRKGNSSGGSNGGASHSGSASSTNPSSSQNAAASGNFDLGLARSYTNMIGAANQSSTLFGRSEASSPFLSPSPGLGAALGLGVSSSRSTPTPAHQSLPQNNFARDISNLNAIGSANQNQSLAHLNPASLASYTSRDSLALMSQAGRSPIVGMDATSQQLYQQYLQRHQLAQEELLLRSAGAHSQLAHQSMMLQQGLMSAAAASYPSGYPHTLGLRSGPYQGMNRPWI